MKEKADVEDNTNSDPSLFLEATLIFLRFYVYFNCHYTVPNLLFYIAEGSKSYRALGHEQPCLVIVEKDYASPAVLGFELM